MKKTQFLIAAPSSGSGKTTFTLGLLRLLNNRGIVVQPYKCGPDYLDTRHHQWAAGRPSLNLDTFMASPDHVKEIYAHYLDSGNAGIVEGVMGLFDGARKMQGSSAEIAELLDIPIVLVVNTKATAYSVAPILYGFKNFYPGISIAGVVFNFVNSESHYQFLKDACEDVGVTPLGYIPRNEAIQLPSRHLGLNITDDHDYEKAIEDMAAHIAKTVDVEQMLELCKRPVPVPSNDSIVNHRNLRIAIARDEAFNFTYHENLRALERIGELEFFSPIHDTKLPDADLVYLAGGYPELFLQELSENREMKTAIRTYCEQGGRLLAECGGMMYLCHHIIDEQGDNFSMVGFLDQDASMQDMKLHLGYRTVRVGECELKGHEFHYSHLVNQKETNNIAKVYTAREKLVDTPVIRKLNTVASYIHFYWGESDIWTQLFTDQTNEE